jgi:hypothetical protein
MAEAKHKRSRGYLKTPISISWLVANVISYNTKTLLI